MRVVLLYLDLTGLYSLLYTFTALATAYSGPGVERTARGQARLSVLKIIIDVERGEVTGHRVLQPHQASRRAHQHLASIGRVPGSESPRDSIGLLEVVAGPAASGELSGRVNNYLGRLRQPLIFAT